MRGQEGHAHLFFGHAVNVFGCFGIELKGCKNENRGTWTQGSRFFPGEFHLAGIERRVFVSERDDHTVRGLAFGFGFSARPGRFAM